MIFALHGFLGLGSDWDFLKENYEIIAPSYLSFNSPFPPQELKSWTDKIAEYVRTHHKEAKVFLGYSLGARLGLYLAANHNELFEKYILIAPHLGDFNETDRVARIRSDAFWAKKFLVGLWDEVVSEWNMQSVFDASKQISQRDENHFSREYLSEGLSRGSIALSENFTNHSMLNSKNVYFIIGENDSKYQKLYAQWKPRNLIIIKDAGHRVPWDSPKEFKNVLQRCIISL